MKATRISTRRFSDEALMWVVTLTCCTVQLLLAADWVGLI